MDEPFRNSAVEGFAVPFDFARGQGFPPQINREKTAPSRQAFQGMHLRPVRVFFAAHLGNNPFREDP